MIKAFFVFVLCSFGYIAHAQIATHVVISEIYGGGGNSGATFTHDFIELYNPTSLPVSLNGWSVQYASAAGTNWAKTDLSGSIPAKGFYLIQQAQGAGGTLSLPTPDATGTIALSGTTGKIALVDNITTLTGSCPSGAQIIDFVGFGTNANCNEGGVNAPAPSNTTSIERKASESSTVATLSFGGAEELAGNGYDAGINGSDFVIKPLTEINPQNSGITEGGSIGNTVTVTTGIAPAEPATDGTFLINLSSPAPSGGVMVTYTLSGTATEGIDYTHPQAGSITIPEAGTSGVVDILIVDDLLAEGNETIILTLQSADAGYAVSPSPAQAIITDDEVSITKIHVIQGPGAAASPGNFTAEAIVTGVYPDLSPAGFYMQEEDEDADGDISTSEGIFVVSADAVVVGDQVRVTGTVQENASTPSFNQAVFATAVVTVLGSDVALPSVTDITLPVTDLTDFEQYEGMLVHFPGTLTVTNNYTLGRYGEVGLSAGGPVYQPTQIIDVNDVPPSGTTSTGNSNSAAINELISDNTLRTILLDDGTNMTVTLPYADPVQHTLRLGSTIDNLTGILGYAFSLYRVQPIPSAPPVFTYAARPAMPDVGAGSIKAASFNVLNYFNGDGSGGGFPTTRGAHSLAEFNRQRDKIISAISQINADVVGLLEIENDGTGSTSAIQDLVNGLNNVMGAGTYSFINDGANIQTYCTDEIRCGILYKPATVTPDGPAMLSSSDTFNRPPLAQKFIQNSTTATFNFVVNHYKSKGCSGASGADLDQADGQSCFNERRKRQSTALLHFFDNTVIPVSGTDRIISVGDYNAYYEEDPLDILRAANYEVLGTSSEHSYQFNGQIGSLDQAVVSGALLDHITGMAVWNINADEPVYLDYNDLVNDGSGDFENLFAGFYTPGAFRSSDHDPVIIGLDLQDIPLSVTLTRFEAHKQGATTQLNWAMSGADSSKLFEIQRSSGDATHNWEVIARVAGNTSGNYTATDNYPLKGRNLYRLKCVTGDGGVVYSTIREVDFSSSPLCTVYPNPASNVLYIDHSQQGIASEGYLQVSNMLNQVILRQALRADTPITAIDLSAFPAGMYYIKIVAGEKEAGRAKFIKN